MSRRLLAKIILLPISKVYGWVMWVRNYMFDHGMLKEREFDVPVIVVGNIAMGGTGKTPHVEYLLRTMSDNYHIGVLSRGYKRKTKGFVQATPQSRPEDIGDESYQIYRKFGPKVTVAVCEKRVDGIEQMLEIDPEINLFILDDAYQHRYVKPRTSVLLTEYNRPAFEDTLLPYGRLREPTSSIHRADIVVVTKCPDRLKPMDYRIFKEKLHLYPFQKLFFSRFNYGHLVPVFPEETSRIPVLDDLTREDGLLAVTGIGNRRPFIHYLKTFQASVRSRRYADHHNYTAYDMEAMEDAFDELKGKEKFIITTEKDAVRLFTNPYFPHRLKSLIFYLPISVEFIQETTNDDFTPAVERALRNGKLFKS